MLNVRLPLFLFYAASAALSVLAALLVLAGCQASSILSPGAFVYPMQRQSARSLIDMEDARYVSVDPAFFAEKEPSQLLVRADQVDFGLNGKPSAGVFASRPDSVDPTFIVDRGPTFGYRPDGGPPGFDRLHNIRGVLHGDDPRATALLEVLFEELLKGAQGGRWVKDPDLAWAEVADPRPELKPEFAPICRLHVAMNPGPPQASELAERTPPGWQSRPLVDLQGGIVNVGVYYVEAEPAHDGRPIPNVFLFSNYTGSHIYLLERNAGRRFHDTALMLYAHLDEIWWRASLAHLSVKEDWQLSTFPAPAPDEMLHLYFHFNGPAHALELIDRGVLRRNYLPEIVVRTGADGSRHLVIPKGRYTIPKGVTGMFINVLVLSETQEDNSPSYTSLSSANVEFEESESRTWLRITEYRPD